MKLFGAAPVDWLVVGLGNPGSRYEGTPHNVGFEVARNLIRRWDLGTVKKKFAGEFVDGRAAVGGPRVGVLMPQTFMNESGRSVSPARGALKVELDRLIVIHDEIDIPFGEIRVKQGGGHGGHNGLRSLQKELGGPDFHRIRVGVGRPDTTDPEVVSSHVLGKWRETNEDVRALIDRATGEVERLVGV